MQLTQPKTLATTIVNGVFLIVFNLALMTIFGYLTIDSWANINSRAGALLLAFFLPMAIVYKTRAMPALERLIKFGLGFVAYMITFVIIAGFPQAIMSGLIPSLTLALAVLYYGEQLLEKAE